MDMTTTMAQVEEVMHDEVFDLVSVLYRCLKEAQTCEQYAEDARERDDRELADFFDDVRQDDLERAERAEALLAARLADTYELAEGD